MASQLDNRASEQPEGLLRAIVDTVVDGIVIIDTEGSIEFFNQAALKMFGYARNEVLGRNVSILMGATEAAEHDTYLHNYLTTGVKKIIGIGRELKARRKDGSLFDIALAISEVNLQNNRCFTGIIRDISTEVEAREEIRRQNERVRVIFEHAPLGVLAHRFSGPFIAVNQKFLEMTGYNERELLQKDHLDITHPDDRDLVLASMQAAESGELDQFSNPIRFLHKDGRAIHSLCHAAVTHDASGNPDMVICQVEDLTESMAAEEKLRNQREQMTHVGRLSTLGEMTAGIAHEVNQPLTAISMYAQSGIRMLNAGIPAPEKLRMALEKLDAQSLRAGNVIDRIQRLVRNRETQRELVNLNELVADLVNLAVADARVNGIEITQQLEADLPLIYCDPIQIQQVLLNLIRNGIDAMVEIHCAHGNVIDISTRLGYLPEDAALDLLKRVPDPQPMVEVSVSDSGTGISQEFSQKVFTPFSTTKDTGMGMGLSICRSIISTHGGSLAYQNNADCGTTFFFHLPLSGEDESD